MGIKKKSLTCRLGSIQSVEKNGSSLHVTVLADCERGKQILYLNAPLRDFELYNGKIGKHYFQVNENDEIVDFI